MDRPLFGTSGIRGDAEILFTNQFCFDLGRTFDEFLKSRQKEGPVAIGRDPRDSSPRIVKALASGLISSGREVFDEGICPVPSVNNILFAKPNLAGSIMVSGSHIEAKLNGAKFFFDKEEILKSHEEEIEKIYGGVKERVQYSENLASVKSETAARDEYIKKLVGLGAKYPVWKAIVDPGNGSQSEVMPVVLKTLGVNVVAINSSVNENFLARDTEIEADFEALKAKVKEEGADFGVGYDSDGDRAVFIDENANFIPGDYTCTLIARGAEGTKIVTPINTSQVIDHIDKEIIRTKVGSPYVVEAMKSEGASFGFEGNGGGIFSDMHSRDGGRMTIEILNVMAKEGKTLSALLTELPKFYITKDKVKYKWELKDRIIEEAKNEFKGIKIEEIDGLKIWLDNATWILFRSSMNAPEFRVFTESDDKAKSDELLKRGMSFVENIVKNG